MLNLTIDLSKVDAGLDQIPDQVVAALETKMHQLTSNLQAHVITDKLHGQVLNQRSGRLARSIQEDVQTAGQQVYGEVFSAGDVKYAGIHEFGGIIPAHDIVPDKAEALAFTIGGRHIFAKIVHMPDVTMPERSFLRSSLADQADDIANGLKMAALKGARQALGNE